MLGISKEQQRREYNDLMRIAAYREAMDRFIAAHDLRQPTQPGMRAVEEVAIATAHIVRVAAQRAGLDLRNLSYQEGIALGVVICGTSDGMAQLIGERPELSASVACAEVLTGSFGVRAADVFHEASRTFADLAADIPPNEILVGLGRGAQRLLLENDDEKFTALADIIKWMVEQFRAGPAPEPTPAHDPSNAITASPRSAHSSAKSPSTSNTATWLVGAGLVGLSLMAIIFSNLTDGDRSNSASRPSSGPERKPILAEPAPPSTLEEMVSPRSESAATFNAFSTLNPRALIPIDAAAVTTIAGTLAIESAESQQQLTLNGRRLALPESYFTLMSITRHDAQDIVLVSMNCGGTACAFLDLAFLRLFSDRPPVIETRPDLQFPSDFTERLREGIAFRGDQTELALGLDKGAFVFAAIGPTSPLAITRQPATIESLTREQCGMVKEAIESCAEFPTPCSDAPFAEFPGNCPDATMPLYRTTGYLAANTTGLNLPAFANTCTAASQLGMAPSPTFIESEICSGADPHQWAGEAAPSTAALN